jgi:hypothetical protein
LPIPLDPPSCDCQLDGAKISAGRLNKGGGMKEAAATERTDH